MATDYGARFSKGLGCTRHAMGGAAENMGIEALAGDTELVTVFDDFNSIVKGTEGFGDNAVWEDLGIIATDNNAPNSDEIYMNDVSNVDTRYSSELIFYAGDKNDSGGSWQFDLINGAIGTITGMHNFQYMWIDETAADPYLDDSTWVFACRVGFQSAQSDGDWDSKVYIGFAAAGDTTVMTNTGTDMSTPIITQPETGDILGFCMPEDGSINLVAQRTASTTYAEGTNYTQLAPAGTLDGEDENSKMWFDLAFRMTYDDASSATANGWIHSYWRRVVAGEPLGDWLHHPTVITNQNPYQTEAMVPTIEVINGPSAGGVAGCVFGIDWWAFGRNRVNR